MCELWQRRDKADWRTSSFSASNAMWLCCTVRETPSSLSRSFTDFTMGSFLWMSNGRGRKVNLLLMAAHHPLDHHPPSTHQLLHPKPISAHSNNGCPSLNHVNNMNCHQALSQLRSILEGLPTSTRLLCSGPWHGREVTENRSWTRDKKLWSRDLNENRTLRARKLQHWGHHLCTVRIGSLRSEHEIYKERGLYWRRLERTKRVLRIPQTT